MSCYILRGVAEVGDEGSCLWVNVKEKKISRHSKNLSIRGR